MIENGRRVSIEYTLKLDDGRTVDSNVGREPLTYTQGSGQLLPALEEALGELGENQGTRVTLPPEKGYGAVDPTAFQAVEAEAIPQDARFVGAELVARDGDGRQRPVRVHEVHADRVVVDMNHPLAGQTLTFEVRVVGVE